MAGARSASKRFLFATWDGGGNFVPALGIAGALRARGHEVTFTGQRSLAHSVESRGYALHPFERAPQWTPGLSIEEQRTAFVSLLCGADAAADVAQAIDLLEPDAIVADCMLAGALAAAERSHVPAAVLVHMLDHGHPEGVCARFFSATMPLVNETRCGLGLPALATYAELIEPMALVLVTSVQGLERPHSRPTDNVRYIGPVFGEQSQAPVAELPPDDQPLVLVSFSTTYQHQEEPLQRVADALAELPVHGLMTLGDVLAPEALSLPANVTACAFASHEVLFARASLVVTHAGLGTVMGALSYGVPLLCMPMGRDQDTNAQRVQELGAAMTLPLDAGVPEIRQAIVEVLDSGCYRDAARRLEEAFACASGAGGAALELERLCTR